MGRKTGAGGRAAPPKSGGRFPALRPNPRSQRAPPPPSYPALHGPCDPCTVFPAPVSNALQHDPHFGRSGQFGDHPVWARRVLGLLRFPVRGRPAGGVRSDAQGAFWLRLSVAGGHVSWAPYLDQWGAEISGVVAPLAHGTLGWRDLVAGNNEHRVLLTRALSLAVIECNGAWDNRVLVIGNYLLESLLVAWVCALAWSCLGWARGI